MKRLERKDVLDWMTYSEQRDALRPDFLEAKRLRRGLFNDTITLLFENTQTVHYQVQEMIRIERIVREADIQHEIDTYNELLGGNGELGCTLLIGIDDPDERDQKLRRWTGLLTSLSLETEAGERVKACWDERQVGEDRLSSVQYLRFDTRGQVPVAVVIELGDPDLDGRVAIPPEQREALASDLGRRVRSRVLPPGEAADR